MIYDENFKNQIIREDVSDILRDILQHKKGKEEHFYFRGESSYHELRTPSLYLEKNLTMDGSEYYYRTLLSELGRDDYQENTSLVRLISELQHYGAKTRMLDITRSPLVALYFAVEKYDNDKPGFVFIYRVAKTDEKFDTGHTVAIKSALNFMPQGVTDSFLDIMSDLKNNDKINLGEYDDCSIESAVECLKDNKVDEEIVEKFQKVTANFMELLNQRVRVRERLVLPFKIYRDLKKAHVVIPSKTTDRIRQQQGAFIYPCFESCSSNKEYENIKKRISESIDSMAGEFIDANDNPYSVIKIEKENKIKIKRQLEQLGITEGFVYPDIEHQSDALLDQLKQK